MLLFHTPTVRKIHAGTREKVRIITSMADSVTITCEYPAFGRRKWNFLYGSYVFAMAAFLAVFILISGGLNPNIGSMLEGLTIVVFIWTIRTFLQRLPTKINVKNDKITLYRNRAYREINAHDIISQNSISGVGKIIDSNGIEIRYRADGQTLSFYVFPDLGEYLSFIEYLKQITPYNTFALDPKQKLRFTLSRYGSNRLKFELVALYILPLWFSISIIHIPNKNVVWFLVSTFFISIITYEIWFLRNILKSIEFYNQKMLLQTVIGSPLLIDACDIKQIEKNDLLMTWYMPLSVVIILKNGTYKRILSILFNNYDQMLHELDVFVSQKQQNI